MLSTALCEPWAMAMALTCGGRRRATAPHSHRWGRPGLASTRSQPLRQRASHGHSWHHPRRPTHTSRQLDTATTIAGCIPSPDYDIMQLASFDMDRVKGAELYIQDPPRGATASTPHAVRERSTNAQPWNT